MPIRDTSGVLLLDKPSGITSARAVAMVKRHFKLAKVGHTGTLDPMATGMLPLCLGQATKFAGYALEANKAYQASIRLGVTTDTGDKEGAVITSAPVPSCSVQALEAVLERFKGELDQIPPMYSALKHNGKRLYQLARQGMDVPRAPRKVVIHHLRLLGVQGPELHLELIGSKGTYVRSLAVVLGEALKCGAHLSRLRRMWVAPFEQTSMHTLDEILSWEADELITRCLPEDSLLACLPVLSLTATEARHIHHGRSICRSNLPTKGLYRAYTGKFFLGVVTVDDGIRAKRLIQWNSLVDEKASDSSF